MRGGLFFGGRCGFGDRTRFANIWGTGEGSITSEDGTEIVESGTVFRTKGCNDASYCNEAGEHSCAVGAAAAKRDGSSVRCIAD